LPNSYEREVTSIEVPRQTHLKNVYFQLEA